MPADEILEDPMISKAVWKYIRISPRKLRLVADVIRGKTVTEAMAMLPLINKRGAKYLLKALKSAVANAVNSEEFSVKEDELYISRLMINESFRLRRWRPISHGRAVPYHHRFSHIYIELDHIDNMPKPKKSKKRK